MLEGFLNYLRATETVQQFCGNQFWTQGVIFGVAISAGFVASVWALGHVLGAIFSGHHEKNRDRNRWR